jgi:DNA-binding phage protein
MSETASRTPARTKTLPYDVAEQLRNPEEITAYLDAYLAEAPEDAASIVRALREIARAKGMLRWHSTPV